MLILVREGQLETVIDDSMLLRKFKSTNLPAHLSENRKLVPAKELKY